MTHATYNPGGEMIDADPRANCEKSEISIAGVLLKGGQMGPPGKSEPVHPAAPGRKANTFKSPNSCMYGFIFKSQISHWCILTRIIIRKKENSL